MGFPAIAMTDHGRMSGAVEFVDACRNAENPIKPIVGVEVYTCDDMHDKSAGPGRRRPKHNHLTLLAKNEEGYKNLLKISSIASEIGYYYDPRVDHSVLEKHSKGIIALSGCLASEVNQALMKDDYELARQKAGWFSEVFDDFYVELQYHGIEEQKHNTPLLIKIANELNLPMVCSNDVHYLQKANWKPHDLLISMRHLREEKGEYNPNSGKKKAYESKQFYLKTQNQMEKIFADRVPEAITNTMEICEKVEDYFKLDIPHLLPTVNVEKTKEFVSFKKEKLPSHDTNDAYLAHLAFEGLKKLGKHEDKKYISRLKKELAQIWYMGVTDYFLIHNEMITYMKENNIMYGVRGSGVGSLVNYCLEIHPVDPIKWDLMFERFLNPGRGSQYDMIFKGDTAEARDDDILDHVATKALKKHLKNKLDLNPSSSENKAKIAKEMWIIENQGLSNYYLHMVNENTKREENSIHSWVAYYLGITNKKPTC
jgi:DNA polymerase-3 subunit alpha